MSFVCLSRRLKIVKWFENTILFLILKQNYKKSNQNEG